jgi:3-hydroxyisobutyrate dehydrogenase-like beta-hydroxyacid dehydrogenase
MQAIGMIGAGAMGSAIGAGWVAAGHQVSMSPVGRSERTLALAAAAGIAEVPSLDDLVAGSDLVVSVVPPRAALEVAADVAAAAVRRRASPLVADLNAVAPSTVRQAERLLARARCDLIDGSLSGPPPRAGAEPVRTYLSGVRCSELVHPWLDVVVVDGGVGAASAVKMCTASMYKGTKALMMQALLTADAFGVREHFLADTAREWPDDVPTWHLDVALAATKAWRFVGEMREIAATQADADLPAALFDGVAAAYEHAAGSTLGHTAPENLDPTATVDDILAALRRRV